MKEFLIYIAQSTFFISIFGGVYFIFLRKHTFFKFNRAFLLVGLFLSFILPSIEFSYDVIIPHLNTMNNIPIIDGGTVFVDEGMSIWYILLSSIYILGVVLLVLRNVFIYNNLRRLRKGGTISERKGYKLIENSNVKASFSVFNQIFMNTESLQTKEKEIILKHEISHINQKHWIDLLCSECALLLQWFNPLMWYYIRLQKENHEYLADEAVLNDGESTAVYRAVLINQQFQGPIFSFANSFNYSNQKNRLIMMKKTKTSPWNKILVLMVLPLLGVFFTLSAKPNYVMEDKPSQTLKVSSSNKVGSNKSSESITVTGLKKGEEPLVIVDGIEVSYQKMQELIPETIESMSVYKGKDAIDKYGKKGSNGVVEVILKETSSTIQLPKNLLYIVDGKEVKMTQNIDPETIESVNVLKDKSAIEPYGEKGKNGVIIITTTKK